MTLRLPKILPRFACCTAVLVSAGCSRTEPAAAPHASSDKASDHQDHGHDHFHDHGIPDHKPASFAEAVQQLPRRQRLVLGEFKVGHLDHAQEAIQKLQDVIRWLPELAADTDLGEADWNVVQSLSQQMEAAILSWPSLQSKPPNPEVDHLTSLIEQLKPLAEKTEHVQVGGPDAPFSAATAAGGE